MAGKRARRRGGAWAWLFTSRCTASRGSNCRHAIRDRLVASLAQLSVPETMPLVAADVEPPSAMHPCRGR